MRMLSGPTKLLLILLIVCGSSSENSAEGPRPGQAHAAIWTVDLRSYGWRGPITESNREFFRDFTLEKLAAEDIRTKLLFISNDVLVAYHTKVDGRDWRTAKRSLDGFFLKVGDGSLLARRQWPSVLRKDGSDADTEARIVALQNGKILVISDGILMLYSDHLQLIDQHKLV
ncbi:MAG: hypothetical protein ACRD2D_01090, partial [Terriglobales bacterium]